MRGARGTAGRAGTGARTLGVTTRGRTQVTRTCESRIGVGYQTRSGSGSDPVLYWTRAEPEPPQNWTSTGPILTTRRRVRCARLRELCAARALRWGQGCASTHTTLCQHWASTGPTLGQHWTKTRPKLDQHWTNTGPKLDQHWTKSDHAPSRAQRTPTRALRSSSSALGSGLSQH